MRSNCLLLLALVLATATAARAQNPPEQSQPPKHTETVDVVGVTPIYGLGVPISKVPNAVQTATFLDLTGSGTQAASDFLISRMAGIHANDAQSNPFQPDVQYRGFVGSPLLGSSQGIAVYQNGARVNEPFGDTLQWSLLPPPAAIAGVDVLPGSNPLFGLNALGGAITIRTKDGFTHPGHGVFVSAGSFGRRWTDVHSGGHAERFSYFAGGRLLAEDGWRDFSSSSIAHLLGTVGWRDAGATSAKFTLTGAHNDLRGNGASPLDLLEQDREAVFTHPDRTRIDQLLGSLSGGRVLNDATTLDGVFYARGASFDSFNGDDTGYEPCDDFEGLLCVEDELVRDQHSHLVAAPDDPLNATNNTSFTRTRTLGGSIQLTRTRPLFDRDNHFVAGVMLDASRNSFSSETELARLTASRGTVGSGMFDSDSFVRLRTTVRHAAVYAGDYFSLTPRLTLSGSARYGWSVLRLRDQIGTALTGDHEFSRLTPAAGLTFSPTAELTLFSSLSVSSRVPTPSELSCADPEDPCRLPNAFVSDPPLKQVIARTLETGARGVRGGINWSAAFFRTVNTDDLLFISSGALTNEGHFANVGDTLRQGVETRASREAGLLQWSLAYTYLRATFKTPVTLGNDHHPDAVDGEIDVSPGNSLPAVPRHSLKGDLSRTFGRAVLGAGAQYFSSQYLRGDEANLLPTLDGYLTVSLRGRFQLSKPLSITGQVTNLFNRHYSTVGLLGEADDVLGDDFNDPRFYSPAAPRAAWVGVELKL